MFFAGQAPGQVETGRGPLPGLAVEFDVAAVCLDQPLRSRQSEAGLSTGGFGGEERVKRMFQTVAIHADAIIRHCDTESVIVRACLHLECHKTARLCFSCVLQQLGEGVGNLCHIQAHRWGAGRNVVTNRQVREFPAKTLDDAINQVLQSDRLMTRARGGRQKDARR